MLKAETLAAYRAGLDRISDGAAQYVERMLREAAERHPDMTVAEWRDLAAAVMQAAAETYGETGASLACELYDSRVRASGYDQATMGITLDPARAMATARYQAGKLVDGDLDGFISECSAFCSDYVREATNSTMTGNWKRSRRSASRSRSAAAKAGNSYGVRFARVPQGGDTCTFCAMLASRGFVYWSRETAGEFDHYHRNCRCLIVPDDGSGEVEGYDPDEWLQRWRDYEEIDERDGLTRSQKTALKAAKSNYGGLFWTRADPALDYFGPAEDDDPDLLAQIKSDLEAAGVEIKVNDRGNGERIAYGPSPAAGEPGNMHVTEGMSLSAWMHEYEHFRQDRDLGFPPSIYYYADNALRASMEEGAYGVEIERAAARGYNELVNQLQELLDEERSRLNDQDQD